MMDVHPKNDKRCLDIWWMSTDKDINVIPRIRYYCRTLNLEDIDGVFMVVFIKMVDVHGCNDGCQGRWIDVFQ